MSTNILGGAQGLARDLDINTLPSVLLKDKAKLPNTPGVYFVESRNVILYIGMTENSLQQRWVQHHRAFQIESQFVDPKIIYYVCSEDVARDLETALIRQHNPLLQNTKVQINTREELGTEILPQVENGTIQIKIETIIETLSSFKDTLQEIDRSVLRMSERVERLEDITGIVLQAIYKEDKR